MSESFIAFSKFCCSDITTRGLKKSPHWKYFEFLEDKTICCKLCDKVLCGNMIRHLKCRHPKSYMQIQKLKHPGGEYKKALYDCKEKKYGAMQTNSLRKYYEDAGDGLFKCKICDSTMRRNKAWHLEQNHPEVFQQYQDFMENSSRTKDDPSNPRLGWIKRFLKRLDTKRCECTVCHKVLRMPPGLLNNLKRHVRLKHPFYYEREVKVYKESEIKRNKRESRKFEMVEYVMEDSNYLHAGDAIKINETAKGDPGISYEETNTDLLVNEVSKERCQSKPRKHVNSGTSDSKHDVVEEIKQRDVENITEALPTKRPHWKYFESLKDKTVRCKMCDKVLRGNIIRHLKCKHWKTYIQIQKFNKLTEVDKKALYDSKEEKSHALQMSSLSKFFKVAGDGLSKCKTCGSTIRGNKAWHLEQNHPEVFTQYQEIREGSSQTTDDPSNPRLGWIKRFLKRLDSTRCECTVCNKVLRMPPGLLNNLKRHVRIKHPFHYEREINTYKTAQNKRNNIESEEFEDVEYIVEDMGLNDPLNVSDDDGLNAIETNEANVSEPDINAVETDTISLVEVFKKTDRHEPTSPTLIEFLDETEPDIDDIIKQLSDKNVTPTHEPNGGEFYILDHGCYKCKECGRIIRCDDNLQMLSKHVEEAHSDNVDNETVPIIVVGPEE